jgi:hypothetical protein
MSPDKHLLLVWACFDDIGDIDDPDEHLVLVWGC